MQGAVSRSSAHRNSPKRNHLSSMHAAFRLHALQQRCVVATQAQATADTPQLLTTDCSSGSLRFVLLVKAVSVDHRWARNNSTLQQGPPKMTLARPGFALKK
ncbi:hypothetical protein HaLaN_18901 [Haematococcus lacustris]|uniref:Uncharacterized protein n=1 Tax=Haematococcus lacustris TaxID=44745 RepID=A0A699ZTC6_HAELA|nr:hypothetical protein HaLaN_18901 [Haematococcus lacustris]